MVKDLINISMEEIEDSANRSVENSRTVIMYLQNTGTQEHVWKSADISTWIDEDLDD